MCGIIGYIGKESAAPILLEGLRRLEYRGYDSAGLVVLEDSHLDRERVVGRIDALTAKVAKRNFQGTMGVAHTRWATHGGVTVENAHPMFDCHGEIALVHNGIIENFYELKEELAKAGHEFTSETDSEVLVHLVEEVYEGDLMTAVRQALKKVKGTYGIIVISSREPDRMIAARNGSPLVIGIGEQAYLLSSDPSPLLPYTCDVVFLNDGEVVDLSRQSYKVMTVRNEEVVGKKIEHVDWDEEMAQKGGFEHYMLKEIHDQPESFQNAIRGRVIESEGVAHLGGLNLSDEQVRQIDKIVILSCGTAYYAGLVGKYLIERMAKIPVDVEASSEFRYRNPVVDEKTLVFVVSQSGETADSLAALREAKRKGARVLGVVNVVGSTIARETDGGAYIHAGPELAVASTKAFVNQIALLTLIALRLGRVKGMSMDAGQRIIRHLWRIPSEMEKILAQEEDIRRVAKKYKWARNFLFLGRGMNYPIAMEGALKLKEVSYIHAEGLPMGEMKHGWIAMIDKKFPTMVIATKNSLYEKVISNIQEIKARKGKVIAVASQGDEEIKRLVDDVIYVPETIEMLEPMLTVIPPQLFAYYMAVIKGLDVDKPRNLAKSVTVE